MTAALTSQGENVSKLEKADILELTVNHLNKMHQARRLMVSTNRNPLEEIHRFQAGYSSCAQEAASFLLSTPGVDVRISQKLLSHLSTGTTVARGAPYGPVHSPVPPSFSMTPFSLSSLLFPLLLLSLLVLALFVVVLLHHHRFLSSSSLATLLAVYALL